MLPGMNPRKMQQMMRQLGVQQTEIPATEVIIKTEDTQITIRNPTVVKVNMMGQETLQISGEMEEEALSTTPDISEEDVKTVMEQAHVSKETARKAITEANGDLAQAILHLQSK